MVCVQGMEEELARFYVACITLALEYLHDSKIVYRDLKPENVFIDQTGYIKLGDFGFAKILNDSAKTYTFCGTPGYVAPENILAHGYNYSADWWGLGVLMYVLLTGRQPFSTPKTEDPMQVMRRIVDETWQITYPPYMSAPAKDLVSRLLERKPARRIGACLFSCVPPPPPLKCCDACLSSIWARSDCQRCGPRFLSSAGPHESSCMKVSQVMLANVEEPVILSAAWHGRGLKARHIVERHGAQQ
jgi:serine/threonine protein kinase